MRGALQAAAVLLGAWIAHGAQAQVQALPMAQDWFTPRAAVAAIWSDNPLRSQTSPGSAAIADATVGVRLLKNDPHFDINADVSVLQRRFLSGGQGSQTLPSGNVYLNGIIVPERLSFTVEDNLGQISTQPFDVLNAADRQTVNFLSFGPDLHLAFDTRDSLILNARYGATNYGHSDINSKRYSGELGFAHIMSAGSTIAAIYRYERIQYQNSDLFPPAEKDVGFLRYTASSFRTYFVLEGGEESIKLGNAGERKNSPHATIVLQRRISPLTTFNAEFSHTYSDASQALRTDVRDTFNTGNNQNVQAVAEPFTVDGGYLMLLRTSVRSSMAWQVTWSREQYSQNTMLDRKLLGSDFVFDRRLSSLWTLAAQVRWTDVRYTGLSNRTNVLDASVGITRILGRSVQAGLVYERGHGGSDIAINRFKENRVTLLLSYSPGGFKSQVFDPVSEFRYYERPTRERLGQPAPETVNPIQ
jgi:hypothetical protein